MAEQQDFDQAAEWLRNAKNVVVFTGAGVSAESGIPTFRDEGGFWNDFPPEQYATWPGILKAATAEPGKLAQFLLAVLEPIAEATPNAAHQAIADLEQHCSVTVVTQNVDGLHQLAGNTVVHEVHGTVFETVTLTGKFRSILSREELKRIVQDLRQPVSGMGGAFALMKRLTPLIGMDSGGGYRPNIVLFGATMAEPAWSQATSAAQECDLLICVGTSGMVYPAASLPDIARSSGANVISVDPLTARGQIWLQGTATAILPKLRDTAFA